MGQLSTNFGKITSKVAIKNGIAFQSEHHFASLQYYSESIVRTRLSSQPLEKQHSYAVIQQPQQELTLKSKEDEVITLHSSAVLTQLDPSTGQISFYNKANEFINGDALPTSWIGTEVTAYKKLMADEKFVGLGEKTGPLNRRGQAYTNWNTDKFGYDVEQDPLYLTAPFYIGIHSGLVYGIFLDNTHRTTFNFGASTERFSWFSAEAGDLDYYFIYGDSVASIIEQYTWLTGRTPLPAKWSLGFQQCRYSYYPDKEVYQLAQTFRDKQIPCDVIYLDIHYMQDYKAFTFDKERFPKPKHLVDTLAEKGIKTAVILDPGIKVEEGYASYDSGIKQDIFVKYPDDVRYIGEVWPGKSHFPDFTNPKARDWWSTLMPFYTELGIKGFWNDMNEPAAWGQSLPNFLEFEFDGHKATHREARNVYGMQMTRSTIEGVAQNIENERPFVLTRAGYAGVQRYSAVWTGDNVSSDEHLLLGVRLVNSLGLTGIANCGNDVGGFCGEASPALYARWISVGAFQPFFRAHSVVNSRDAEPWSFGEEVEQIARNYIQLRYQLMPYLYSGMWEASQNGMPLNRSFVFEYPHDERTFDPAFQHQFMVGASILIAPVASTKDYLKVWLPEGTWYNFWNGQKHEGNQELIVETPLWKLPVFIKAGAIIPMQSKRQHLDTPPDELVVHIYGGADNEFTFYEDDGVSYDYQQNNFAKRNLQLTNNQLTITAQEGNYNSSIQQLKVIFHVINPQKILINKEVVATQKIEHRMVDIVKSIDTFSSDLGLDMKEDNLIQVTCNYSPDLIQITW